MALDAHGGKVEGVRSPKIGHKNAIKHKRVPPKSVVPNLF
jgi:hypothetical protein